jgi:hypothetical protein
MEIFLRKKVLVPQNTKGKPKILLVDIETAPILGHVWGLFDNNVALNQIVKDWHLLSWSAKWLDSKEIIYSKNRKTNIMYQDQSKKQNIEDDKDLALGIWKLLDEADIVIGQNSKRFDIKKLNARFKFHDFQPPSSFRQIDTLVIAKKHFAFTSNKLEYLTDKFCKKYKKLKHKKFPGHELWNQCLKNNKEAWTEMKRYNTHDVLSTEEIYYQLIPWDNTINFNVYHDSLEFICTCGSKKFISKGYHYTSTGKFSRHKCKACGSEIRGTKNLFDKEKRDSLMKGTIR